jgi:hypothetical protein
MDREREARMTAKLRAGLIRCGFVARNHRHAWRELAAKADLLAACDLDSERARAAQHAFDAPSAYTDAATMLDRERLDFVDIVTTMPSHRALVLLAAAHKVAVIVPKPFPPTWDDCLAMAEDCRDVGVPLMVHENFRFQAPMLAVAEVLRGGVDDEQEAGQRDPGGERGGGQLKRQSCAVRETMQDARADHDACQPRAGDGQDRRDQPPDNEEAQHREHPVGWW